MHPLHLLPPDSTVLCLSDPEVTDEYIEGLGRFPNLRWLDLSRSSVTDAGLRIVARCPRLRRLELRGTGVSTFGRSQLRRARPGIRVDG